VTEARDGVADLTMASGKRLARLQRRTVGKHSRFDLSMPYLRLNVLSAALQEVADAPHPLPAILDVVEKRHCQVVEQAGHHHLPYACHGRCRSLSFMSPSMH